MVRPLAYITANWSDNEFEAKSTALRYCRKVYDAGFSPICPRLMYEGLLRDEIPQEHKDRIEMASELLRRSRILVVCGDSMDGQVKDDIGLAKRLRIAATTLDGIMKVEGSAGKKACSAGWDRFSENNFMIAEKGGYSVENRFTGKRPLRRLCQRQNENASGVGTDRLLSTDDENAEKRYDTYSKKIYYN